jgi:hypothetical protein
MEKKKKQLEEWGFKSIPTSMGEMYTDHLYWEDLVESANVIGAEIFLLKKRDGERVYQSLGRQFDKHDRVDDFNDKCVDVFFYHEEWEEDTIREVFERCIRHRLEDAMSKGESGTDDMLYTLNDFDRIKKFVEEEFNYDREILIIDEYLSADVIERYPTLWYEDVWEYRMALKLNEE